MIYNRIKTGNSDPWHAKGTVAETRDGLSLYQIGLLREVVAHGPGKVYNGLQRKALEGLVRRRLIKMDRTYVGAVSSSNSRCTSAPTETGRRWLQQLDERS
jgi:RNA:NAD 2'-phosphotransferase (TPT1/KptA family)